MKKVSCKRKFQDATITEWFQHCFLQEGCLSSGADAVAQYDLRDVEQMAVCNSTCLRYFGELLNSCQHVQYSSNVGVFVVFTDGFVKVLWIQVNSEFAIGFLWISQ